MPRATPPAERPKLRARDVVVTLVVIGLGVAAAHWLDARLQALFHAHPAVVGGASAALFLLALVLSRAVRRTVLAYLTILALAAPFVGAMVLARAGLLLVWRRETADTIFALCVMLPLTLLLFWVLIFAARTPPTGHEGWLRRLARRWGGAMPVHRPGPLSHLHHFSQEGAAEPRADREQS